MGEDLNVNYENIDADNYRLITATGLVKVEIQDLRKLFDNSYNKDFMDYFKKKYLVLTSIREKEKDAYENYQRAKEIAKPEERSIVKTFEQEYQKIRNERIKLQAELKEKKEKFFIY